MFAGGWKDYPSTMEPTKARVRFRPEDDKDRQQRELEEGAMRRSLRQFDRVKANVSEITKAMDRESLAVLLDRTKRIVNDNASLNVLMHHTKRIDEATAEKSHSLELIVDCAVPDGFVTEHGAKVSPESVVTKDGSGVDNTEEPRVSDFAHHTIEQAFKVDYGVGALSQTLGNGLSLHINEPEIKHEGVTETPVEKHQRGSSIKATEPDFEGEQGYESLGAAHEKTTSTHTAASNTKDKDGFEIIDSDTGHEEPVHVTYNDVEPQFHPSMPASEYDEIEDAELHNSFAADVSASRVLQNTMAIMLGPHLMQKLGEMGLSQEEIGAIMHGEGEDPKEMVESLEYWFDKLQQQDAIGHHCELDEDFEEEQEELSEWETIVVEEGLGGSIYPVTVLA